MAKRKREFDVMRACMQAQEEIRYDRINEEAARIKAEPVVKNGRTGPFRDMDGAVIDLPPDAEIEIFGRATFMCSSKRIISQ